MKYLKIVSIFVISLFLIASGQRPTNTVNQKNYPEDIEHNILLAEQLFSSAYEIKQESDFLYKIYAADNKFLGWLADSSPLAVLYSGHGGPVPFVIGINPDTTLTSVVLLDNEETPGYIDNIIEIGFLDSWKYKTFERAVFDDVDTVSGATESTSAIVKTMQHLLDKIEDDIE